MRQTADYYAQAQTCLEKVIREYRPTLLSAYGNIEPDIKSDNTPVTDLDKALEAKMRQALLEFDGGVKIVGEEQGGDVNTADTHWLVDPIDGTESFVRGLPFARNMATLIDGGEPVFAFVYKLVTDELYVAGKGQGATRNGEPIHVSSRPLSRAWIELSVPTIPEIHTMTSAIKRHTAGFRTIGDFTLIPEGKLEAAIVYKSGGGLWDYAPRALLVSEAGGRVGNIGADGYTYRNTDLLLANEIIFDDLMDLISKNLATGGHSV